MRRFPSAPVAPYLWLMAYLVAVKLVILWGSPTFRSPAQAAVFAWPFLAALVAVGLLGIWLSPPAGIPALLDANVARRARFLWPALAGLTLGGISLLLDGAFHWTQPMAAEHGLDSIHIPFPASALIYPGGAIIVCVIYYLLPIPLFTWLVRAVLRGRRSTTVFWVVGGLAAAIEPLTQDLDASMRALGGVMVVLFALDYVCNLAQVVAFRRAGFLAAVTLRVAFYLVWHIVPSLRLA